MKSVKKHVRYYWGIDAGTNSMGHAATDTNYNLLKINGEPAWGVTVFDEASSCSERATFRTSRRRRRRAKFRVKLLQDLFAPEIAKLDENFLSDFKEVIYIVMKQVSHILYFAMLTLQM